MNPLSILFIACFFLGSCANHGQLTPTTKIPKKLSENSGIVQFTDAKVWLVEDNGNKDVIFQLDFKGNILRELEVKNAKNRDWEDLTKDKEGNLYIGDFGNNDNTRKDLTIYKLPNPEIETGNKINSEKIKFYYPEQKDFPPKKNKLVYDAEAFFHHNGLLYIITKNRTHPFSGEAMIYSIPDEPGKHEAQYLGKLFICSDSDTCKITSAAISPDGTTIVLLGYGKLWTITNFTIANFSKGNLKEIDLGIRTQLESVCFQNATTLVLSDEEREGKGRNLYSYILN